MHTEHMQNVRFGRVALSWVVGAAVTSFVLVAFAGLGRISPDDTGIDNLWSLTSVAVGFWFGGLFAGLRAPSAPILHGVAIGLLSLPIWFVLNVLVVFAFPNARWEGLGPLWSAALILLQMVAAVAGAWTGRVIVRREGMDPDLAE